MKKLLYWVMVVTLTMIVCIILLQHEIMRYNSVKKFFPDLTFAEYIFLGENLRITPHDR